jgi:hypothetical protein
VGNAIQAKIAFEEHIKIGDTINITISYLGKNKIAVEKVV